MHITSVLIKVLPLLVFALSTKGQTISWTYEPGEIDVFFRIDSVDYPDHKHRTSRAFQIKELDDKWHEQTKELLVSIFSRYPDEILREHVQKVYVYEHFQEGASGLYIGRHGFFIKMPFTKDGSIDSRNFARLFHHEMSHRLLMFVPKGFDLKSWKSNNGYKYGTKYDNGMPLLALDSTLFEDGFLCSYGITNKLEDFACIAERLFVYFPEVWEAIKSSEALRRKVELAFDYYEGIHPTMNRAYFLDHLREQGLTGYE